MPLSTVSQPREPKRFKIPSRSFGITAEDAAEDLALAEEIKMNKPLLAAASKVLSEKLLAQRQAKLDAVKLAAKKAPKT